MKWESWIQQKNEGWLQSLGAFFAVETFEIARLNVFLMICCVV